MPVIHTHVSVPTTPEQREALKAAYGKAITAVPGKSEGWLMCPFEDNMPIYFGGSDDQPAAYVEVNVFGRSVPGSAWEKLTEMPNAGELTDEVVDSFLPWSDRVPESCKLDPAAAEKAKEMPDDFIINIDPDAFDDEMANNAEEGL